MSVSTHSAVQHIADDLLDADAIRAALPTTATADLAALDVVASLDSTNSELLRRDTAFNGASVLLAEQQTGGRGRHGRVWISPPACNLYLSIARDFNGDFAALGGLSVAVGIAAVEALHAIGASAVQLKWPNDLVVASLCENDITLHKLGGVLIEGGGMRNGKVRAVIGIGINVRMPRSNAGDIDDAIIERVSIDPSVHDPRTIDQPWIDLHALLGVATPSRNQIAAHVIGALLPTLDAFDAEGLTTFLPRYARLDALYGCTLDALIGPSLHSGIARGLNHHGALRLDTDHGELLLQAGEVHLRRRNAG